jgi:hypothetical protein
LSAVVSQNYSTDDFQVQINGLHMCYFPFLYEVAHAQSGGLSGYSFYLNLSSLPSPSLWKHGILYFMNEVRFEMTSPEAGKTRKTSFTTIRPWLTKYISLYYVYGSNINVLCATPIATKILNYNVYSIFHVSTGKEKAN